MKPHTRIIFFLGWVTDGGSSDVKFFLKNLI